MYKHVLIPVQLDETRDIARAIEAARMLANDNADITFLHVVEPLPSSVGTYLPPNFLQESHDILRKKLADVASKAPGAKSFLVDGSAGRSITGWAQDHRTDCIVIPSHQPAFSDVFLGSTAAWVVRHARCSVHVVR